MPIHTILVPTDFSPDAERALEWAMVLARPSHARIQLFHSCYLGRHIGSLPEPLGIPLDFAAKLRAEASAQLEALEKRVAAAGLASASALSEKPPVAAIVDQAKATEADLIVMGTRGLDCLSQMLLGSVAERTVRLAPCPVLTVQAYQVPPSLPASACG